MIIRVGMKLSQQVQPIPVQREAWRMADAAGAGSADPSATTQREFGERQNQVARRRIH